VLAVGINVENFERNCRECLNWRGGIHPGKFNYCALSSTEHVIQV
jgi:hypothetical protein